MLHAASRECEYCGCAGATTSLLSGQRVRILPAAVHSEQTVWQIRKPPPRGSSVEAADTITVAFAWRLLSAQPQQSDSPGIQ